MPIMLKETALTLKQIQLKLGVPQYVLIHLCEKGVIEPEFEQTQGRGQWRKFSHKNLFEFAVALELRKYEVSVSTIAVIIRLLSSFERATKNKISNFELPNYLITKKVSSNLFIFNGTHLLFEINKSILGFNLVKLLKGDFKQVKVEKFPALPSQYESYLKINLTEITRRIA